MSCSEGKIDQNKEVQVCNHSDFQLPELPHSVSFCGKEYILDNFEIRERLDKEIIVNTYYHSSTIQSLKRINRYFPKIEKTLKANKVPEDFKYLCLIESNLMQAVSPSGAKGFWQFMPATAKEYGLIINDEIDERLNIEKSTMAACKYLLDANSKFDDWMLTAAAYNRGVNGIMKDLEEQQVNGYFDLHLNNETSRYVFRILALKLICENPEMYGFSIKESTLYAPIKTRTVEVNNPIENLSQWAIDNGTTYRMVKVLNPWIIGSKLSAKNYRISLPIE